MIGPLPTIGQNQYFGYLYSFMAADEELQDPRNQGRTVVVVVFFFQKTLEDLLPCRKFLENIFLSTFQGVKQVKQFSRDLLDFLKHKIALCATCLNLEDL